MTLPKNPEPRTFADFGIHPGEYLRLVSRERATGSHEIEQITGTVEAVYPTYAVLRTAKGYRETVPLVDLTTRRMKVVVKG